MSDGMIEQIQERIATAQAGAKRLGAEWEELIRRKGEIEYRLTALRQEADHVRVQVDVYATPGATAALATIEEQQATTGKELAAVLRAIAECSERRLVVRAHVARFETEMLEARHSLIADRGQEVSERYRTAALSYFEAMFDLLAVRKEYNIVEVQLTEKGRTGDSRRPRRVLTPGDFAQVLRFFGVEGDAVGREVAIKRIDDPIGV